jgi:phage FluMu protein gp41
MNAKICENNDGSRVNLDKLSKRQLNRLKKKVDEVDVPVEEKYAIN